MKCPRCGLADRPVATRCSGCGFTRESLDRLLGDPPAKATPLLDGAALLDAAQRSTLESLLAQWALRAGGELAVVTVATTAPVRPSEYAFWLFNRWGLGAPHRRGLLLLLAVHEQRIELEVGYGWEHALDDLATGEALERHALPRLRERDFAGALTAAVDALGAILLARMPAGGASA